jgi:hypothetical protein
MKKVIFKSVLIAAVLTSGALTSCEKDDDDDLIVDKTPTTTTPETNTEPTELEKLTNKEFVLSNYTSKVNGFSVGTFSDVDDCDKDDIFYYKSDNTGTKDEGAIKCFSPDPQIEKFTFKLIAVANGNDSLIVDYENSGKSSYTIIQNTGTQLTIREQSGGSGGSNTLTEDWTYTKK